MPTKKELEDQVKSLKATIREHKAELKKVQQEKEVQEDKPLDKLALGGYFNKKHKQWVLVHVGYDPETGMGRIIEEQLIAPDRALFEFHFDKNVVEKIHLPAMREE